MKTTIDIPENDLMEAIRFSGAHTKKEAILTALTDYNKRQRMARLTRHLGTCEGLLSVDDLQQLREAE